MSVFSDVRDFMKIGHPDKILSRPEEPDYDTRRLCEALIKEEYLELRNAFETHDLVEAADAMADLIYVVTFAAHCYGIPLERVWAEVQRTNMAKFPGGKVTRRKSDSKIMKPDGWEPPNIEEILNGPAKVESMLYFGCWGTSPGHGLHGPDGKSVGSEENPAEKYVGAGWPYGWAGQKLDRCPELIEGQSVILHDPGWTILSFADRSVDTRRGSHSTFVARGVYMFDEMWEAALRLFPVVCSRYSFEVKPPKES